MTNAPSVVGTVDLRALSAKADLTYYLLAYDDNANRFQPLADLPSITLDKGSVILGSMAVESPSMTSDVLSWSQQSDRGFSVGQLFLGENETELRGTLAIGADPASATLYSVVASALPLWDFHTELSQDGQGEKKAAPTLAIAYEQGGQHARRQIRLNDQDISQWCIPGLSQDGTAQLTILPADIPLPPDTPLIADDSGLIHLQWRMPRGRKPGFRAQCAAGWIWSGKAAGTVSRKDGLARSASPVLPTLSAAMAGSPEQIKPNPHHLLDLIGSTVADSVINQAALDEMMAKMKWCMERDSQSDPVKSRKVWLKFLSDKRAPLITESDRKAEIGPHEGWYRDKMGLAIFANALAQQKDPDLAELAAFRPEIKVYLETCLVTQPEFLAQYQKAWLRASQSSNPRLAAYVAEDQEIRAEHKRGQRQRKPWADRILEHYSSPAIMKHLLQPMHPQVQAGSQDELIAKLKQKCDGIENSIVERKKKAASTTISAASKAELLEIIKENEETLKSLKGVVDRLIQSNTSKTLTNTLARVKTVSGLLRTLDPSGSTALAFSQGAGATLISQSLSSSLVHGTESFQRQINAEFAEILKHIMERRVSVTASVTNPDTVLKLDEIRQEITDFIHKNRTDVVGLAGKISSTMSGLSGKGFETAMQLAGNVLGDKVGKGLSKTFKLFAAVATIGVFVRVVGDLTGRTDEKAGLLDEGKRGFRFAQLVYETLCFKDHLKEVFASQAGSEPGLISRIISGTCNLIGELLTWSATQLASAAKWILPDAVLNFFKRAVDLISDLCGAIANSISGLVDWTKRTGANIVAQVKDWAATNPFAQKIRQAWDDHSGKIMKCFTFLASVYTLFNEAQEIWRLITEEKDTGRKISGLIVSTLTVLSACCSIFGVITEGAVALAWSGIGTALAVIAIGAALISYFILKPESLVAKIAKQEILPWVKDVVVKAVDPKLVTLQRNAPLLMPA